MRRVSNQGWHVGPLISTAASHVAGVNFLALGPFCGYLYQHGFSLIALASTPKTCAQITSSKAGQSFECECEWLLVSLSGPAVNWWPVQAALCLHPSWDMLQQPHNWVQKKRWQKMNGWMDGVLYQVWQVYSKMIKNPMSSKYDRKQI